MIKNNHKPVILFDVNETLLDMTPIKERINTILDHTDAFRIWFGLLLQYSLVANNTANYRDFPTIAGATLNMVAESFGLSIDDETKKSVLGLMTHLTAYPDVEPGLKKLSAAGFRLATLTNSPKRVLTDQLNFAGIQAYFESTLSIDAIKTYKPSLNTYQWAAEQLGVGTGEIILPGCFLRSGRRNCFWAKTSTCRRRSGAGWKNSSKSGIRTNVRKWRMSIFIMKCNITC